MGVEFQKLVAEDFELGYGTVQRSMPGGGSATGSKVNLATFQDNTGELYAALPSAAAGKGSFRTVRDSNTTTVGATVAGGGSGFVVAWSNGTVWKVVSA